MILNSFGTVAASLINAFSTRIYACNSMHIDSYMNIIIVAFSVTGISLAINFVATIDYPTYKLHWESQDLSWHQLDGRQGTQRHNCVQSYIGEWDTLSFYYEFRVEYQPRQLRVDVSARLAHMQQHCIANPQELLWDLTPDSHCRGWLAQSVRECFCGFPTLQKYNR